MVVSNRDFEPKMSGKVSSQIRVRFNSGSAHVKPRIVTCTVIKRYGSDSAGQFSALVLTPEGNTVLVEHSLIRGLWRPRAQKKESSNVRVGDAGGHRRSADR
jgi:hypothetical protein